jgi:hypothetical protein
MFLTTCKMKIWFQFVVGESVAQSYSNNATLHSGDFAYQNTSYCIGSKSYRSGHKEVFV